MNSELAVCYEPLFCQFVLNCQFSFL